MIDFKNADYLKLKPIGIQDTHSALRDMLLDDEKVFSVFKSVRDQVVFTDRRIIAVNVQGITGKKVDFTSIPYNKIQVFSVETAGVLDLDCELEVYVSAVGKMKFEFTGGFDIVSFNKAISKHVLG